MTCELELVNNNIISQYMRAKIPWTRSVSLNGRANRIT